MSIKRSGVRLGLVSMINNVHRLTEKNAEIRNLQTEVQFRQKNFESNNVMWSNLLSTQAQQLGVSSFKMDLLTRHNDILKTKLTAVRLVPLSGTSFANGT